MTITVTTSNERSSYWNVESVTITPETTVVRHKLDYDDTKVAELTIVNPRELKIRILT